MKLILLIIGICFLQIIVQTAQTTEYIKSPKFSDSKTPWVNNTIVNATQIGDDPQQLWKAYLTNDPTKTRDKRFYLIDCNHFNTNNYNPDQYCVFPDTNSNNQGPLCIVQTIPTLPAGNYTFSYRSLSYYINTDLSDLFKQIIVVNVSTAAQTFASSTTQFTSAPAYPFVTTRTFQLLEPKSNVDVAICQKNWINRNFYEVTDVSLLGPSLEPCEDRKMAIGPNQCVPLSVIQASPNCYSFVNSNGVYSCFGCDTTNQYVPFKVQMSATAWGCGQVKVPGVKYYKASTIRDTGNYPILIPDTCNDGITKSSTARVVIPKNSASLKDSSAFACRSDFSSINLWEVVSGKYVAVGCSSGNLVDLVTSSSSDQPKACASSASYDANCKSYTYSSGTFTCTDCKDNSAYTRLQVKDGTNPLTWKCVSKTSLTSVEPNKHCPSLQLLLPSNVYDCLTCYTGYRKINFVVNGQTVFKCVTERNYVDQCDSYRYVPVPRTYKCQTCKTGYSLIAVQLSTGRVQQKCVLENTEFLPSCKLYFEANGKYYCKIGHCTLPSVEIRIGSDANQLACTGFELFSSPNQCSIYQRPTKNDSDLKCSICKDGNLSGPYCGSA